MLLEVAGLDRQAVADRTRKLASDDWSAFSPAEQHAYAYARKLSKTPWKLTAGDFQTLADDLNTPAAVAALSAPLKALNDLLHTKKGRKAQGRAQALACYHAALAASLQLLGLPGGAGAAAGEVLPQLRALALVRWVGVCVGGGL